MLKFGVISGLGWLIDFTVFYLLVRLDVPPFFANVVGAGIAVTFVFFSSVKRVFQYEGGYLLAKLAAYIGYQIIAVAIASALIDLISRHTGMEPLLAKILVTPFTFYANFQFMSYITTGRLRLF
jgi:putative flippase GtrA